MFKKYIAFSFKFMVAHVLTYFVAGALAYQLLTKNFYQGVDAVFKVFMRTESEPFLWDHVMTWMIPGQIVRGILMGTALFPFIEVLKSWKYWKRVLVLFGIYIVFAHLSATGPTTSNIEGLIYLRPEIMNWKIFFATQPEIIVQGLILAMSISGWMVSRSERKMKKATQSDKSAIAQ